MSKPEPILRTDIRTDKTQSRAKIDPDTLHDYADLKRDGVDMPPLVVFYDGESYWLADGFHRYFAAQNLGLERVLCDVREGTCRDALAYSLGANQTHGRRRTNDDKQRAVEIALDDAEWSTWSDRAIADLCGVSHPFVGSVRACSKKTQVETVSTCPKKHEKTRVGSDGKKYPSSRVGGGDKPADAKSGGVDFNPPATPPPVERLSEWNRQVESFARSITAIAEDAPAGAWWDEEQTTIVAQQLKSAAGAARLAKCADVCPKCDGGGCKKCRRTGLLPKRLYDMATSK